MANQFDFTFKKYSELLYSFLKEGYEFQTLEAFFSHPSNKVVILRHDVDRLPLSSLKTAKIENNLGIKGTYYFRISKQSNHPQIIEAIVALGHEIGYHYEDLALSNGILENAIHSFGINMNYFRKFYPVKTICMHGSPLSKWDNRDLWKSYSYRDYGILAEPYFDLNFDDILYLTDTGRKWNGEKSSVRDKVLNQKYNDLKKRLKTSDDILQALSGEELPEKIMLTTHPQRWTDQVVPWLKEYYLQALKNSIKQLILVR
jgi:hypothetical protein